MLGMLPDFGVKSVVCLIIVFSRVAVGGYIASMLVNDSYFLVSIVICMIYRP